MQEKLIENLEAVGRSLPRLIELAKKGKMTELSHEDLVFIECGERKDIPPGDVKEVSMTKTLNILRFTL